MKSVFETLAAINCNGHTDTKKTEWTDKKGIKHEMELTYLSWAWAWHHTKREFPDASYTIYENQDGRPYFDDGRTAWVKTGVTINGLEHIEYLPIMDYRNASIPVDRITSMDMNKAIQRSLTKACARHGLGLYIYAGEDLPDALDDDLRDEVAAGIKPAPKKTGRKPAGTTAPAPAQEEPAPQPETPKESVHEQWVRSIATNAVNKNGVKAEDAYRAKFNPTEEQWQALMEDVFRYQLAHGISE